MRYVIIVGTGGFARELLWLIQEINLANESGDRNGASFQVLGFISEHLEGEETSLLGGLPVLGDDAWAFEHLERNVYFVPGVGNSGVRKRIGDKYQMAGFRPLSLVHPNVRMADDVSMGAGVTICAGAVLTTNIEVGAFSVINLNATVGHDCVIGDYSTIHPGVNVSGGVTLGVEVELGTGSALLPGVTIGDRAVVGAGAVVTGDLEGGKTYVGIPAKILD